MRLAIGIGICLIALTAQAQAQSGPSASDSANLSRADIRELIDATKAAAKASRENVDYNRVVPDILTQILAKLDKIEDKLDKVEATIKRTQPTRVNAR
ncbi:hypothetical protein [Microvirga lotononidis]|uniref:Uncharacterized protein n=1 Tax=Microvirga lotononidis TaxID=864069 RepID=I4YQE6_9HYPH|nr:hypothetical protein [Microvirga lotononidis]EIM26188.1 hypothetical protein MicloDRAFT_00051460 [Microvirga lotononidis]WQO31494.1 hypothetical protein U0023_35030 [Microvirga lotononidis]